MPLPRVLRTATFRLGLLYVVLFGASAIVLFATLYWSMTRYAAGQIRVDVEAEVATLTAEARYVGLGQLAQTIAERLSVPEGRSARYLLLDTDGRQIAGNLPPIPVRAGWSKFTPPASVDHKDGEDEEERKIIGFALSLPKGGLLFVGHDTEQLVELRELVVGAFAWASGVTLGLALLGAAVLSQGFLRRIEAFNCTTSRIIEGNLTERVPTRNTGDELDRLASNVNRMLDRIQELMEGLRQVSSDIAHDLRTPMARLRQGLETARRRASSVAEYEEAFDQAINETDGILRTFGALLRIAQIEAGTRRAGFSAVNLSVLFETIVEAYAAVAEDHGQTLSGHIASGVIVRGDKELLIQMLANLVENAIHHTPAATRIDVSLNVARDRPVGTVGDTGPGVPADERDKVFRRFYRLDSSRTTTGSGLGLSLVTAIAELHEIVVTLADNAPGLRVTLDFPPTSMA